MDTATSTLMAARLRSRAGDRRLTQLDRQLMSEAAEVLERLEEPPWEPVGGMEMAARLGVAPETPSMWRHRKLLPEPRWTVSGEAAWDWHRDILPWAKATNRWPPPKPRRVSPEASARALDLRQRTG